MNAKKNAGIIVFVLLILGLAGVFFYRESGPGMGYGYGGHMMYGMGSWGMGGLMLVFWGLVLFGLILMINWMLTATRNEKSAKSNSCSAEDIIKSRYARGEIDQRQYKKMRDALSQ